MIHLLKGLQQGGRKVCHSLRSLVKHRLGDFPQGSGDALCGSILGEADWVTVKGVLKAVVHCQALSAG